MEEILESIEQFISSFSSNVKIMEKAIMGLQGSYVELLTVLSLALLSIIPVLVPKKRRQFFRHLTQLSGIFIFIFVVFTCLGVFGMIRNFHRGLNEVGRENIVALYYMSVPLTILVTSLLFGSNFCGWICPTGALQEFMGLFTGEWCANRKKAGYRFSYITFFSALIVGSVFILWMWRLSVTRTFFIEDSSIYWSEVLIIIMFLLVWKMKDWDGPLRKLRILSFIIILAGAAMSIRITSPVHFGFAKVYDPASFLATAIVALSALVIPRIWCRYLCPWKEAIAWASKYSVRKLVLRKEKCSYCGICDMQCDMDAVKLGEIKEHECIMCYKCVDKCPENAIEIEEKWHTLEENAEHRTSNIQRSTSKGRSGE